MTCRILLIDNYDSFTYNLYHLLASVSGSAPCHISQQGQPPQTLAAPSMLCAAGSITVLLHDRVPAEQAQAFMRAQSFDCIVVSPGPGTPDEPTDIGMLRSCRLQMHAYAWSTLHMHAGTCLQLLAAAPGTPVLGVCLGMQLLASAAGAAVVRAPEPRHGRLSAVRHTGHALFHDIPSGM